MEGFKVCHTCEQNKPLSDYGNGRFRSGRMQLQYNCKPCHAKKNWEYKEKKLPPPKKVDSLLGEEWKLIYWFTGRRYYASNYGRIKAAISKFNRNEKLKTPTKQSGDSYPLIRLSYKYKEKVFQIHTIVARLFVKNPYMKPYVNHKDGDKLNYFYENLEWCTLSENTLHYIYVLNAKVKKGEEKWNALFSNSEVLFIYNSNKKIKELAELYGVRENVIRNIKRGYNWGSVTGHKKPVKNEEDEIKKRRDILDIFQSKERLITLAKRYNTSYSRVKYIRNGRSHSIITGKSWVKTGKTINQYV